MQSFNLFAVLIVTFCSKKIKLERHLTTCSHRVKIVFPRNVHQIREFLFDKPDFFGVKYACEQNLVKTLATIFDFESICVQEETFNYTNTTTWIGKHVPISATISANLMEEPIFLCNPDPHLVVATFIGSVKGLASQSKTQKKLLFPDIKTTMKIKLGSIQLSHRYNRQEQVRLEHCGNERCASTQFLRKQKKQLINLQEYLERHCNLLSVSGCNSPKQDLNLINSYLPPNFLNERDI